MNHLLLAAISQADQQQTLSGIADQLVTTFNWIGALLWVSTIGIGIVLIATIWLAILIVNYVSKHQPQFKIPLILFILGFIITWISSGVIAVMT